MFHYHVKIFLIFYKKEYLNILSQELVIINNFILYFKIKAQIIVNFDKILKKNLDPR